METYLGEYILREFIALVLIVGVMAGAVRFGIRTKSLSERIWATIVVAVLGLLFMSLRLDYPFHGIIALICWMLALAIAGQVVLAYLTRVKIISVTLARLIGGGWHKILTAVCIIIILLSSVWYYSDILKNEYRNIFFGTHFPVQRAVNALIGNFELTVRHEKNISYNDLETITNKLEPGDLLVKRNDWQMGNYWIPGYWTHAGIYIGNTQELADKYSAEFVNSLKTKYPETYSILSDINQHFVLESVTDGVSLRPIEKIAKVDHFAAVRPNVPTAILSQITSNALSHYKDSFDFVFDFESDNAMFCSELIYKTYGQYLALEPTEKYGRLNLSPSDIIKLFDNEQEKSNPSLIYVVFYDSDPRGGVAYEAGSGSLRTSWERKVPPTGYWGL